MISILIALYNGVEFIDESVMSVIKQTYTQWEILIGVNGHLENSEVYITAKKYQDLYPSKIRVFDLHDTKGKPNTLNKLVQLCNFNYIAILDVDDIWHDDKLEHQRPYLNKYDVIGTKCSYFGDISGIPSIPCGDISNYDFFIVNPVINSSSIIRKELCFWNDVFLDDYDLWLRLRIAGNKFYNCSEVLVKHRIHKSSNFNSNPLGRRYCVELKQKYRGYVV
jgi:teichuronic acid biosynthesis glycosyltransferase TuaG